MTDDNLKRAVRAYKQTYGVKHTAAFRIVTSASRQHGRSRIEPPVELRLVQGHSWADLVLDGRSVFQADERLEGDLRAPLAEETLPWPRGGRVKVAVHAYLPPEWKGSAVTTLSYPDGFTLAHVSPHLADYNCTARDVESAFRNGSDVFRDLLDPADARSELARSQVVLRATNAAARIREHVADTSRWFESADPSAGTGTLSSGAVELLWTGSAVGFSTATQADEVFDWLPHFSVPDAVEAGFDLEDPLHRKWLRDSGQFTWPWVLKGSWHAVKELHGAGWSRRAVRDLLADYSIAYYDYGGDPADFSETDGPGWVELVGSPQAANPFLEKHVSLHRAQAQAAARRPLADLLEEDIDIDDALDWVDRYLDALKALPEEVLMAARSPVPLVVQAMHTAWEEPASSFLQGRFVEQEGSWYVVMHSKSGWTLGQVPGAVDAFELPANDAFYGHGTRWSEMTAEERRTALLAWADEDGIFTGPDALLDHLREQGQIGKRFEMQTRVFASMLPYFTGDEMRATIGRPRWDALLRSGDRMGVRTTLSAGDI